MSILTTIDEVSTPDAVPKSSPFKISKQSAHDEATVKFTPVTSDASPIRSWRVTFNGNRKTGVLAGNLGAVCGLDRCGAPRVMPLSAAHNVQRTEVVTYTETGAPADGDYTVEVACASDTQGWG